MIRQNHARSRVLLPLVGLLSLLLCLSVSPRIDAPVGVDLLILLAVLYRYGVGALLLSFP